MATPAQIIENVLDNLERPDLQSLAVSRFSKALRSAHSIELFRRDLTSVSYTLSDYAVLNGRVGFPLPADYRKIYRIVGLDAAGIQQAVFEDLKSQPELRTYYGVRKQRVFNIFGAVLNLEGVDSTITAIRLEYFKFPNFVSNSQTGEYTTDSWIAADSPEVVEAYLQHNLAMLTEDSAQIASAEKLVQMTRRDLINNYVEDIV